MIDLKIDDKCCIVSIDGFEFKRIELIMYIYVSPTVKFMFE